MKVGFIGLGRMGQAMTRRLLEAGHEVGVYNRTAGKIKPLIDAGAKAVTRSRPRRLSAPRCSRWCPTTPRRSRSSPGRAE